MQRTDIFAFPVYEFTFADHAKHKPEIMRYLYDPAVFADNTQRETLKFTNPDLHNTELFKPHAEFFVQCLQQVMTDLGYKPLIELTAMWATVHEDGGFHHRHTHHNSFLAGVYYLNGTSANSGTVFYNPNSTHNVIDPARIGPDSRYFRDRYTTSFTEGKLYIFPSWLSHNTNVNHMERTNSQRAILSFNSMPVGATNTDAFDRYNYQSVAEAELMQNISQRYL